MSEVKILQQFKNNIITFLDELINQFPEEGDLVIIRIFLKDRYPIVNLMNMFVFKVLPYKQMFIDRNEDFLLNNPDLVSDFRDKNKINHFKKLWRSESLDKEDKLIIWKWFDSFITLAERYQECKLN